MSQMLNFSLNVLSVGGTIDEAFESDRWSPCILFLSEMFRLIWTEPLLFTKSGCWSKVSEGQRSAKSRPEERLLYMS